MLRGFLLLCLGLNACTGSSGVEEDEDAGTDIKIERCEGDTPPPDGGVCPANADADTCGALVQATCGETCGESPGCAAATLLGRYEPARCGDALNDTQTFPICQLGSCEGLVIRACGGDPPVDACLDAPGCAPALDLRARANDAAASQAEIEEAKASCRQALEDEVVFASCP